MSSYDATIDWRQCFINNKIAVEKDIEQSLLQSVKEWRSKLLIVDETVNTFNQLVSKYGQLMHNYSIVQMCLRMVSTVTKLDEVLPNVPVKIEEWKKVIHVQPNFWYQNKLKESFIEIGYTEAMTRILLAVYCHLNIKDGDDSHVEAILKLINDSKPKVIVEPEFSPLDLTPFTTDLSANLLLLPRREWSPLALVKAYGLKVEPITVCSSCQDIEYMSIDDDCKCNNPILELTVRRLFELGDNTFMTFDRTHLMTVLELAIIMNRKFKWGYIACSDRNAFIKVTSESDVVCEWQLPVAGEPSYSRKRTRVILNISTRKVETSEFEKFWSLFD